MQLETSNTFESIKRHHTNFQSTLLHDDKVKGASAIFLREAWMGCTPPIVMPLSPQVDMPQSVKHGQYNARLTVNFAAKKHCPSAGTHFPSH